MASTLENQISNYHTVNAPASLALFSTTSGWILTGFVPIESLLKLLSETRVPRLDDVILMSGFLPKKGNQKTYLDFWMKAKKWFQTLFLVPRLDLNLCFLFSLIVKSDFSELSKSWRNWRAKLDLICVFCLWLINKNFYNHFFFLSFSFLFSLFWLISQTQIRESKCKKFFCSDCNQDVEENQRTHERRHQKTVNLTLPEGIQVQGENNVCDQNCWTSIHFWVLF